MKRTYETSQFCLEDDKEKVLRELKLGYLNLSDGAFEQAKINFMLALQYDSKCADAYWGLTLVKFQIENENILEQSPLEYKSVVYLPECENALKFANENQLKIYSNLLEEIVKINEGDNY